MKRIFKPFLVWILCLLVMFTTPVLQPAIAQVARDSSAIQPRYFSEVQLDRYRADPDFTYELVKEPASSIWDRFWDWFWNKIGDLLSTSEGRRTFKYSLIVIAVVVLVLFLLQLRKMQRAGLFSAANAGKLPFSVSEEDIHGINFDAEIDEAVQAGNYRLAVRMLYLQTLKKLSDSGLIIWRIDKTNVSYLSELGQASFSGTFRSLTDQFERNWYGNITIRQQEFETVRNSFLTLHSQFSR